MPARASIHGDQAKPAETLDPRIRGDDSQRGRLNGGDRAAVTRAPTNTRDGIRPHQSVGLSGESVACGVEVVLALLRAKEIADFTDGAPEGVDGPDGAGSQEGLQLCESHLDWIEVGAIGRKE